MIARLTAVDHQRLAMDERRVVGRQERVRRGHLLRRAGAAQRDLVPLVWPTNVSSLIASLSGVRMKPGTQTVHPDAAPAELDRHRPGELQHAALRRVVVREELLPAERVRGRHVHDHAAPARDHPPRDRLRHQEHPAQVHPQDPVPLRHVHLEEGILVGDPRIVDEHVDRTERGLGGVHETVDVFVTPDVTRHAVQGSDRRQFVHRRTHLVGIQPAEVDAAAFLQEPADRGLADAATPAGDQDTLVGQAAHRVPVGERRERIDTMRDMRGMVADVARPSKGVRSSRGNRA